MWYLLSPDRGMSSAFVAKWILSEVHTPNAKDRLLPYTIKQASETIVDELRSEGLLRRAC